MTTDPLTPEERESDDAFWREQEAGNLPRDRGGYVAQGFRTGFLAARAQAAPVTAEAIAGLLAEHAWRQHRLAACACGWRGTSMYATEGKREHRAHQADVITRAQATAAPVADRLSDAEVDGFAAMAEVVERSSLGTPDAAAARASVSDEQSAKIVRLARDHEVRQEVREAVEEWFGNVDLDDLYAVKGWSS